MATNAQKNLGRLLETGAIFGSAAVSRNPKEASSTIADVNFFYQTGGGL